MTGFAGALLAEQELYDEAQWAGVPKILGPRWAHLPVVTVCLLGVQILWSVEMSYASPYLLSLGLTKSWMAIVFLAGPLSGLIMQPLIGVLADSSKSRFGRRRPYMIGGTLLCMGAMLLLGFTRPFASIFTRLGTSSNNVLTIWLAVVSIYCIDFSINAVQAMDRALLVDTLPTADQADGNAWAARMLGIGNMAGFFVGNVDLPGAFPFLGKGQLEVLSVIASMLLISTQMMTALCVKEKVLISSKASGSGFRHEMAAIISNMLTLPRVIRQICIIQFFAWLAWFPVLFYTTLYIGELHKQSHPLPSSPSASDILELDAEATRLGSRALFFSSVLSLGANIVLPFFVGEARRKGRARERMMMSPVVAAGKRTCVEKIGMQMHLASLWASSHAIFAVCMVGTLFTSSVFGATILMTITGFSWAITQWAPFSLLAEAILTEPIPTNGDMGSIRLADARTPHPDEDEDDERQFLVGSDSPYAYEGARLRSRSASLEREQAKPHTLNSRAQLSRLDVNVVMNGHEEADVDVDVSHARGGLSAKAGIILGIHNIFIVVPQFLATGLSSIIFAMFDPNKSALQTHPGNVVPGVNDTTPIAAINGTTSAMEEAAIPKDGPNSVAIIFRVGGVSAAIAFVLCWRLARELKHR